MISLLLILLPFLAACAVWFGRRFPRLPRMLLVPTALLQVLLTALLAFRPGLDCPVPGLSPRWIGQDSLSIVFLCVTSGLFLVISLYLTPWLEAEKAHGEGLHGKLLPDSVLIACLLAFLSSMTLVVSARNFGLLWVAVEATTLASAPLIQFHRSEHSLEAMWKYLLICSVGIGLALFGTMMLALALLPGHTGLGMEPLVRTLDPGWFKAAYILMLAGYGTKMGLAPFHTWLPDAHSEAPGAVSALLSGSLLNCSFLGILRVTAIAPESLRGFCSDLLTGLGFFSLAVAAFFIIRQSDFKRMLAYSSVEHVGLLALMWGMGLSSTALIHLCGHSLLKMTLFLLAGNFLLASGTRRISELGGLSRVLPRNSILWIAAGILICGMPPSPLFVTEFLLIRSAGPVCGLLIALLLFAVFAGMTSAFLNMTLGENGKREILSANASAAEKLAFLPAIAVTVALCGGIVLSYLLLAGRLHS